MLEYDEVLEMLMQFEAQGSILVMGWSGRISVMVYDDYDGMDIEDLHDYLAEVCEEFEPGFYSYFHFEGFYVQWGYEAYDE